MDWQCDQLLKLLQHLPLDTVKYSCAYGSGAVAQDGENLLGKMLDLIVVSAQSEKFHRSNIELNPSHYSLLRFIGPDKLAGIQRNYAARVYCNTQIKCQGRLIKYSVIDQNDFLDDLLDWRWLYIAGRLQKHVINVIEPEQEIQNALLANRISALQAALLLLPEKFSLEEFYDEIVSLSYRGDFRMIFGEDKNKVKKIVAGSKAKLDRIYLPLLQADDRVSIQNLSVEQDWSASTVFDRILRLPQTVHYNLQKTMNARAGVHYDVEELAISLAHRLDSSEHISRAITQIVRQSAWQQTVKNALTAGFLRSITYSSAKFVKMLKSLR